MSVKPLRIIEDRTHRTEIYLIKRKTHERALTCGFDFIGALEIAEHIQKGRLTELERRYHLSDETLDRFEELNAWRRMSAKILSYANARKIVWPNLKEDIERELTENGTVGINRHNSVWTGRLFLKPGETGDNMTELAFDVPDMPRGSVRVNSVYLTILRHMNSYFFDKFYTDTNVSPFRMTITPETMESFTIEGFPSRTALSTLRHVFDVSSDEDVVARFGEKGGVISFDVCGAPDITLVGRDFDDVIYLGNFDQRIHRRRFEADRYLLIEVPVIKESKEIFVPPMPSNIKAVSQIGGEALVGILQSRKLRKMIILELATRNRDEYSTETHWVDDMPGAFVNAAGGRDALREEIRTTLYRSEYGGKPVMEFFEALERVCRKFLIELMGDCP